MWTLEEFESAVRRHDARLAELGLAIWVGSEPTFTDRAAQTPEWLNQALGGDKERRAQRLLGELCRRFPGALALRSVGRQYPGEERPRWNLGCYRRRDATPIWAGPPDPILAAAGSVGAAADLGTWAAALAATLRACGWRVEPLPTADAQERRLLLCLDAAAAAPDADDPRLARASVHARPIAAEGLRDELAEGGAHLFILSMDSAEGAPIANLELPSFDAVASYLRVLECVASSALACGLSDLILSGYPPPVDATVEWTTVTPDPAVIEVNTAPSVDAGDFLGRGRDIYAAAAEQGLAPYRLYFDGAVADSGGAGQITLGGPAPAASPFLVEPRLLPRLVRFLNRHPALSYLYAHDYIGAGGQAVRADERGAEALDELALALDLLERRENPTPELLWHSLASFLCDAAGNSHRAEMNIEKLWNPFLAGRGRLGLVEFRALRMQHTPERATALACLLRAVVAMLARAPYAKPLIDWGRELHERFALPFYLEQDLEAVLGALDAAGLGLDAAIQDVLRHDEFRYQGRVELPGCILEARRALEFWPLLGDAASPEQGGGSRLVDASTARLELRLRPLPGGEADWGDWQVLVDDVALPLRPERDARGPLKLYGLRYRAFVPGWGLHPALGAQGPIRLRLRHPGQAADFLVTLHEWRPGGGAYPGLPADLAEADARRAERVTLEVLPRATAVAARAAPAPGQGEYCLDLRRLAASQGGQPAATSTS